MRKTKFWAAAVMVLMAIGAWALPQPIPNGVLTGPLNGNGYAVTNVGSIVFADGTTQGTAPGAGHTSLFGTSITLGNDPVVGTAPGSLYLGDGDTPGVLYMATTGLPFPVLYATPQAICLTNCDGSGVVNIQAGNIVGFTGLPDLPNLDGIVVCPYTNLPAYITNVSRYFGPWLGPNYVQLAVNSLTNYSGRQNVGGGRITVVGINYLPTPLMMTNAGNKIASYDIEAPAFTGGALVCATNPCLVVSNSTGLWSVNFTLKNCIVASLQNQPALLVDVDVGVADTDIEGNWFGWWNYLTNNTASGVVVGLVTPNTGDNIFTNDLVVAFNSASSDEHLMANNHFTGLAGVLEANDHAVWQQNWFMQCGVQGIRHTDWPTTSIYWTGAALVLAAGAPDLDRKFFANVFYQCGAGYYVSAANLLVNTISLYDYYEQTPYTVIANSAQSLNQVNPFIMSGLNKSETISGTTITADTVNRGAMNLQYGSWPFTLNGMPPQILTNNCTNVTLNGVTELQSSTATVTLGLSTATVGTSLSFNGTTVSTPAPFSALSFSGSGTGLTGMTSGQIAGLGSLATLVTSPNASAPGQLLTSTPGGAGWSNAVVHKSVMDGLTVQPSGLAEFGNGIQAYGWRSAHSVVSIFTFDPSPWNQATALNSSLTNYYIYATFMTTNAMSQPLGISVALGYSTNATSAGLVYYGSSISSNNVAFTSATGTNNYTIRVPFSIPYGLGTNLSQLQVWLANNLSTPNTNLYFLPGSYIANQ
jgi:hypothetical protein